MIPLIGGDPAKEPATSTRFVLPFAYQPQGWEAGTGKAPGVHYEFEDCSAGDWKWRHDYFTPETADVLYRRACWAKLVGAESLGEFEVAGVNGQVLVRVAPPALMLFEWPDIKPCASQPGDASVLQTGFLILELFFPDPGRAPLLNDLMLLNERFRYWRQPWKEHPEDSKPSGYLPFLGQCPVDFLDPGRTFASGSLPGVYFTRWASLLDLPVHDRRGRWWRLFPREWADEARRWIANEREGESDRSRPAGWVAYADTRTFVWSCALAPGGGNAVRHWYRWPEAPASDLPPWIHLLNVDAPEDTATEFEREWARARTYGRWQAQGTFYGFAYHGAAMLGPPLTDPPLWRIFGSMYFDQVLLLLYLRVTTFRFSYELSRMSSRALRSDLGAFYGEFKELRQLFALFTNLYEFPLLSQQQQAIEMYSLARRHMDVHELFEEIREEIQSSHEFVDLTTQRNQAEAAAKQAEQAVEQAAQTTRLTIAANRLSVVAAFGAAGALVTGFLGMNLFDAQAACDVPSWLRSGWHRLDEGIVLTLCGFVRGSWVPFLVTTFVTALLFLIIWRQAGARIPIVDPNQSDTPSPGQPRGGS